MLVMVYGGKLLNPIIQMVASLGDGVMYLLQKAIVGTVSHVALETEQSFSEWILAAFKGAIVALTFALVGTVLELIPLGFTQAIGSFLIAKAVIAGFSTFVYVVASNVLFPGDDWPAVMVFPLYEISIQEIFSGDILLLDANFFKDPHQMYVFIDINAHKNDDTGEEVYYPIRASNIYGNQEDGSPEIEYTEWNTKVMTYEEWNNMKQKATDLYNSEGKELTEVIWNKNGTNSRNFNFFSGEEGVECLFYFKNDKIDFTAGNVVPVNINSTNMAIKKPIAQYYYAIRNIAIIASMIVLLYIGIKIVLSSSVGEKSKYKEMLMDWLIGLCLIIMMHYIMIFLNIITEEVTDLIDNSLSSSIEMVVLPGAPDKLVDGLKENGYEDNIQGDTIYWQTNMMGKIRINAESPTNGNHAGYAICFIVMVFYTISFIITYLKRVLYLAFLTVIAPLTALTYPIDKIKDGKAQAFEMWLKEYIFNLLIQPLHLLLYYILIGMAMELANSNIIYTLVALGFIMPAEKFVRKMFGFDKAATPGFLSGAFGGAAVMSGINALSRLGKGPRPQHNENGGSGKEGKTENKIRTADSNHSMNSLFGASADGNTQSLNGNGVQNIGSDRNNSNVVNTKLDNNNSMRDDLYEDKRNLQSGRNVLDEFEAEGAESNNWTDEDYEAFDELEKEQLEKERLFEEDRNNYNEMDSGNSDRSIIDEWKDEAINSDDWSAEDFDALDQLEREQLEQEGQSLENGIDNGASEGGILQISNDNEQEGDFDISNSLSDVGSEDSRYSNISRRRAFGGYLSRRMSNAMDKTRIKNGTISGFKTLGKLTMGVAGASVGLAAGIATGDLNKVTQNVTAGAVAGGAIGSKAVGGIANTVTKLGTNEVNNFKEIKENWKKDKYGSDYSKYEREKLDEEFLKDKEIQRQYKNQLNLTNKEEVRAAMEDAVKYREYGITDNSLIIKAMKQNGGNKTNRADKSRIATAAIADRAKNEKDLKTMMDRFAKTPGVSAQQIKQMEKNVRQLNNL